MRSLSAGLKSHLEQTVMTLCTCWKIKRQDGTELGFTDHDVDITYDGLTYEARGAGNSSSIQASSTLAVDNAEVETVFDSAKITEEDLMAGLYDNAEIWIFLLNYEDTSQGEIKLLYGRLGEVKRRDNDFVAEFRSLSQMLQQSIGRTYGYTCDAIFGDTRCGINKTTWTVTGTVTSVTDRANFADSSRTEADGYFNYGDLTWTSGNNNGQRAIVKKYLQSGGNFELMLPAGKNIQVGDTYSLVAGCDKKPSTCKNKFNNFINFRGFPHIPGRDEVFKYPDAK